MACWCSGRGRSRAAQRVAPPPVEKIANSARRRSAGNSRRVRQAQAPCASHPYRRLTMLARRPLRPDAGTTRAPALLTARAGAPVRSQRLVIADQPEPREFLFDFGGLYSQASFDVARSMVRGDFLISAYPGLSASRPALWPVDNRYLYALSAKDA